MKASSSYILSLLLLINATASVSGLKFPIRKRSTSGAHASATNGLVYSDDDQDDIGNIKDMHYTTNITLNGHEIHVLIDTGSSDLWVMPPNDIGEVEETELEDIELEYGQGYVSGNIAIAPFEFGSYKIDRQAYLHVEVSTLEAITAYGIYGLLGLGFSGINSSEIQEAVVGKYGPDAKWGNPVLQNIFDQHPDTPNFIGLALDRTDDWEDTDDGSFTIGEYDEDYLGVKDMPHLYQYPENSGRWTTLLDSIIVDGHSVPLNSTVHGAPSGKLVALLDSGTPHAYLPTHVSDAIYSQIPGAVKYDNGGGTWIVPCNASISVEFVFGERIYPIHPLDLTTVVSPIYANGANYTACSGAFSGDDNVGGNEFDAALGDSFLRNVYSIYDFGDNHEDNTSPFMQLLSITDPVEAVLEHTEMRTKNLEGLPHEIAPADLIALLDHHIATSSGNSHTSNGSDDDDDDGITEVFDEDPNGSRVNTTNGSDDDLEIFEENPDGTPVEQGSGSGSSSGSGSGSGSGDSRINTHLANDEDEVAGSSTIDKYAPAMLGLLAANLLIGVGLLALAILGFVRRGAKSGTPRAKGVYAPVGSADEVTPGYGQYQKPYDP